MAPTLLINEYVLVAEANQVSRGDLVTYLLPKDNRTVYIKRVVGMPGDRIRMIEGRLHINGAPVALERLEDFEMQDFDGKPQRVPQYRETLPGGRSHRILDMQRRGFLDNTQEYAVPAGHYFMMGDNRDNSSDSRCWRSTALSRPATSWAVPNWSISRWPRARACGRSGAGPGRCAGAACLRGPNKAWSPLSGVVRAARRAFADASPAKKPTRPAA